MEMVVEPARRVPVAAEVDVLVVGGGPAGTAAAVAAARAGASTLLVERYGFLGGTWTAGMVLALGGYNSWLRPYKRVVDGIPGEWLRTAHKLGGAEDHHGWVIQSDPEIMKLAADEMIRDSGASVWFHAFGTGVIKSDNRVQGIFVESVSGREAVLAKVIVDCTGNADVAARAGARLEKAHGLQPMTLTFRLAQTNPDSEVDHRGPWLLPIGPEPTLVSGRELLQQTLGRPDVHIDEDRMLADYQAGKLPRFGGPWWGGMSKHTVWVNAVRVDGDGSDVRDLTRAEMQGRRDAHALARYLKETFPDQFGEAVLLDTAAQIGVRETRRIVGDFMLTQEHVLPGAAFEDSIAVGAWPIDVHPAGSQAGVHDLFVPNPYPIPYRCLIPRDLEGLLVAGRCVSMDRAMLGSARVGATAAALGHAAGVAAALAAKQYDMRVRAVDYQHLRRILQDQGAIVDP